jgi:hypothetical protein
MAFDFREIGASRRRYTREDVLDVLEKRAQHPAGDDWRTSEFRCQELTRHLYLLTYRERRMSRQWILATVFSRLW